jgi:hypothetical protein
MAAADTAMSLEAADTADLVLAIQQAHAGQRKLDALREVLQRAAGRDLAAEVEEELLQPAPETPSASGAQPAPKTPPRAASKHHGAPWNLPKTSPTHVDEGWEAGSWKEDSWEEAWKEGSWKEEPRKEEPWNEEPDEEPCKNEPSSSSAAAPPAVAKAKARATEEGAWYETKESFEGNGRCVEGQSYRPRATGGKSGDKLPRWGNRGGKKSAYFNGWHAAKKRGPEALAAYEAEHKK